MKRHESIIALSRDHHAGLLCCWKIRQGVKKNISLARMQDYVRYFWADHLEEHFEEEETILFSALQHALCKQAIAEHQDLRERVHSLNTINDLNLFADHLEQHIRFEERTLFPFLEKNLPENVLTDIGQRLEQTHSIMKQDNYQDEFWT